MTILDVRRMNILNRLADPVYVAKFQRLCGIETTKPLTCEKHSNTIFFENLNGEVGTNNKRHTAENGNSEQDVHRFDKDHQGDDDAGPGTKILTNNNELKENDKNATFRKKVTKHKNGFIVTPAIALHNNGGIYTNTVINNSLTDESLDARSPEYIIKYKSLLYLAHFGAFLGNEGFYLTFFPFCLWNLDGLVTRQTAYLWCIVMYLGQATKDYLRWPRPPCPPVIRLETHYLQEFSMPSTHAMAGTAIPLYLAYITIQRYQIPVYVAAIAATLWFSITCLSRIYLGVHTFLDLLAGLVYAVLIFFSFMKYVEDFDSYHQTHLFAVMVVLFTGLMLCTVCYPSNFKSSSKGDAVQIVASLTGVAIGMWLCYHLGYSQDSSKPGPYPIMLPTWGWIGMALVRFITGVFVLAIVHTVARLSTIQFFSYLFGLDKPDKSHPSVMTAYKFTTYCLVGTCISFFVPIIHLYFGIHRPAIFMEMS